MISFLIGFAAAAFAATALADGDPFEVQVIPSSGRTVTAELADLDGDGRTDVWQVVVFDLPPHERRLMRAYFQRADGTLPAQADHEQPLPERAAAYDIADVDDRAGDEILFLRSRGVAIARYVRSGATAVSIRMTDALIPEDLTIGADSDERGLDRVDLANHDFGDEVWLIVPGIGETFFLSPTGELRARIRGGARANYFIQPHGGPVLTESDIQLFLDTPRISVGDIDGDGQPDILASTRHELRIFLRRPGGGFSRDADRSIALGRVSLEDHIRGSGSVRTTARDIDGDGRLDLLLSITQGGLMNSAANSYVYFNRNGGWDLATPDVAFESAESISADHLADLDRDGKLEIVRMGVSISVLEIVEIFVQRALDAWLRGYSLEPAAAGETTRGDEHELFAKKVDVKIDFETSRPAGFIPTINLDLNGDGYVDYLGSADGTRIEVLLGSGANGFGDTITQQVSTEGQIREGDVDGDGLPDLILFNGRRIDQPVLIVKNRGVLPGTSKRTELSPAPN